jgi:hypothetical protein
VLDLLGSALMATLFATFERRTNPHSPEQTCLWTEIGIGSDQRRHVVAPLAKILIVPDPRVDASAAIPDHCIVHLLG